MHIRLLDYYFFFAVSRRSNMYLFLGCTIYDMMAIGSGSARILVRVVCLRRYDRRISPSNVASSNSLSDHDLVQTPKFDSDPYVCLLFPTISQEFFQLNTSGSQTMEPLRSSVSHGPSLGHRHSINARSHASPDFHLPAHTRTLND
jgi:hypothetical protein